jgi:hypothetical protein
MEPLTISLALALRPFIRSDKRYVSIKGVFLVSGMFYCIGQRHFCAGNQFVLEIKVGNLNSLAQQPPGLPRKSGMFLAPCSLSSSMARFAEAFR